MEASLENRPRDQGIRDDDGGGSGSTMGPMDWQQQHNINFPCYRDANSNTALSLSHHFLVLIQFSSDYFFPVHYKNDYQYCNHVGNIFVPSVH